MAAISEEEAVLGLTEDDEVDEVAEREGDAKLEDEAELELDDAAGAADLEARV